MDAYDSVALSRACRKYTDSMSGRRARSMRRRIRASSAGETVMSSSGERPSLMSIMAAASRWTLDCASDTWEGSSGLSPSFGFSSSSSWLKGRYGYDDADADACVDGRASFTAVEKSLESMAAAASPWASRMSFDSLAETRLSLVSRQAEVFKVGREMNCHEVRSRRWCCTGNAQASTSGCQL